MEPRREVLHRAPLEARQEQRRVGVRADATVQLGGHDLGVVAETGARGFGDTLARTDRQTDR